MLRIVTSYLGNPERIFWADLIAVCCAHVLAIHGRADCHIDRQQRADAAKRMDASTEIRHEYDLELVGLGIQFPGVVISIRRG